MDRPVEPGLLRLFRYFSGIGIMYFAFLWLFAFISQTNTTTMMLQSKFNMGVNILLFVYLSIPWLQGRLGKYYLPLAITIYSLATVLSSLFYLADPNPTLEVFFTRSWSLVPILFIPLVFIAWQYTPAGVMAYNLFANGTELILSLFVVREITLATIPFIGLPILRAFAFGIVGHIISELVAKQREQRHRLLLANVKMGQYAATLEQLTESRERNRIARELHDTLAHTLSGVAVNLEATKTLLPDEGSDVADMINHSLLAVRSGLNETRRVLQNLRAQPLEDLGLSAALSKLVDDIRKSISAQLNVTISNDLPALPAGVEQAFYRVAQESLENIRRHAAARSASLSLRYQDNMLQLAIQDDGVGVKDATSASYGHFGIKGMQERAAAIGADLSIESVAGKGTQIRMIWEGTHDQRADM